MLWVATRDRELYLENKGISVSVLSMWLKDDVDCELICAECELDPVRSLIGLSEPLCYSMPMPEFVVMMSDGQCVTMGSHGVARYPSWAWLQAHSGASMEHYDVNESEAMEEWAMKIIPYGPFEGVRAVDLWTIGPDRVDGDE